MVSPNIRILKINFTVRKSMHQESEYFGPVISTYNKIIVEENKASNFSGLVVGKKGDNELKY